MHVDSAGNPEQLKVTVGLKPVRGVGVTVNVVVTLCPRETVRFVGLAATPTSTIIKATGVDEEPAECVSPP